MTDAATLNRTVQVGPLSIANDRPFVLIAGPCAMESRAHALETSHALVELTRKLGIGLIYKSLLRQGQPDHAGQRPGDRAGNQPADPGRGPRDLGLPGPDRHPSAGAVRPGGGSGRRAPDPRFPVPPDRPAAGRRRNRPGDQRQEGPVPGPLGHEERRGQARQHRAITRSCCASAASASATTRWCRTCASLPIMARTG